MEEETVTSTPPPPLPGFVLGWVIADLVLCFTRVFEIILLIDLLNITRICPSFYVMIFEVVFDFMIIIFASSSNIMILLKKPFGIKLACINIIVTICSVIVALVGNGIIRSYNVFLHCDFSTVISVMTNIHVNVIIEQTLRCVFLVFYWKAILQAKAFFAECAKSKENKI